MAGEWIKCASTMTTAPLRAPEDKDEQRAIAHILGTLDDKIELNQRVNDTLEAMARALFKAWFVDFEPVVPYVTGAVQPKLSQGRMNMMPFTFPGESVCRAFAEVVRPWFAKHRANADSSRALAALRDTLLPKLISGELRIKDAEGLVARAGA